MNALRILWAPRGAAEIVARSPLWVPLLVLGGAATFADYPLLLRLGGAGLAQLKLDNTPAGLLPFGVMAFLAMRWAAPVMLPMMAVVTGRFLGFYALWFLDQKVDRAAIPRIAAYGMLPLALERMLTGTVTLVCGGDCDRFNPVATNLAFFFDATETSPFWYELARGLDVFGLWALWATSAAAGEIAEEKPAHICPVIAALWLSALLLRSVLLD